MSLVPIQAFLLILLIGFLIIGWAAPRVAIRDRGPFLDSFFKTLMLYKKTTGCPNGLTQNIPPLFRPHTTHTSPVL